MCKFFGLRGFDEYRDLICVNVIIGEDGWGKFVYFVGGFSKMFKGGLVYLIL